MSRAVLALACLALGLCACAVPLRGPDTQAALSSNDATLDGRLVRCSALGAQAQDDPDCVSAFAEARRRILPISPEE